MEEIGENQIQPTMIYCDNVSAIKLEKQSSSSQQDKEFWHEISLHSGFGWEEWRWIEAHNAHDQLVDIFTKEVAKA